MEWPLAREGGVHVPFGVRYCNLHVQKTRHRLFFSSWLQGSARNRFVPSFGITPLFYTRRPNPTGTRGRARCETKGVIWNRTDSINRPPSPAPGPIGIFPATYSANPSHPSPSIGIALILRRWTPRKRMATNSTDPVAMPATMHSFLMPSVSACADAGYMQIPVLVVPLYFIPIAVFLVLLGIVVIIISEGISTRRSPAASVTYGSWPKGLDSDQLTNSAAEERELLCTAIELLDQPGGRRVPDVFRCPISLTVMRDPVLTSDGMTYERQQVREFLSRCGPRSPLTKQAMADGCVVNFALVQCMEAFLTEATAVTVTKPALEALIERLRRQTSPLPPPSALPTPAAHGQSLADSELYMV